MKIIRLLGFGGGTAFPGLIIEKYNPEYVSRLTKNLYPIILVTGTNGKTTTSKVIQEIFKKNDINLVHNRGGANLFRGIASALIENERQIRNKEITGAIFEVEEASLPTVVSFCKPDLILLTNIFRDQLDAYGEVETTAKLIKKGVDTAFNNFHKQESSKDQNEKACTVVFNADDPRLNHLTKDAKNKVAFGIDIEGFDQINSNRDIGDSSRCPNCRSKLEYSNKAFSHLGTYRCLNCGFSNSTIEFQAKDININNSKLEFTINGHKFNSNLEGLYNVYNLLGAITTADLLGISLEKSKEVIKNFKPAFGRGEEYKIGNTKVKMILVKNPTGFNSSLDIVIKNQAKSLVLALNDNIADGRDVSWIWDVDFEKLANLEFANLIVTGKRAEELKLRLKYAGFDPEKIVLEKDYSKLIKLIKETNADEFYILPTYTAMLDIRQVIKHSDKEVKDFWK